MKTHPGFLENYTSEDYNRILDCYNNDIINVMNKQNVKPRLIKNLLVEECPGLQDIIGFYQGFIDDERYFVPIQLPNCKSLIVNGKPHTKYLGSTKGLPLKVFDVVQVIHQKKLDLNALDYSGIEELILVESEFLNLNFVKKWNPKKIYFRCIDFKNFSIFGNNLETLTISNDCGRIDFQNITSLKKLKLLCFENAKTRKHYPEFNKHRYVNVLEILNLHKDVDIIDDTPFSRAETDVYAIVNKYFRLDDRSEHVMDCAMELLENGYIYI